jgi:DeoR/GlpR family transcriptional regulator of sugar metabolism
MTAPARTATRQGTRTRREALVTLLRAGTTRVEQLAALLGVSTSTVRRDLARLTADGQVARTYGGALVPETFHERSVDESARVRLQAKGAIAAAAAPLVPEGATIFLDAGTTCTALAARLLDHTGLTVVTRGLETAATLAASRTVDVVVLGGRLRPTSHGLVGPLTDLALDRMVFDLAVLSCDAVDPVRGLGEPTLEETTAKERVAARARRTVVLADSTKLAPTPAPAWAGLPAGWTLITDAETDAATRSRYARHDVDLVVADSVAGSRG